MENTDKSYPIQSEWDSSIDGGVFNDLLSKTISTDIASLHGQPSEDCSLNDKHTIYTGSVDHPEPTHRTNLNQDTEKDFLQENINITVSNYESICETHLDSSQKKCNDQEIASYNEKYSNHSSEYLYGLNDVRNQATCMYEYAEYEKILVDYNLYENEGTFSQGYDHVQLPIQIDETLDDSQLQDSLDWFSGNYNVANEREASEKNQKEKHVHFDDTCIGRPGAKRQEGPELKYRSYIRIPVLTSVKRGLYAAFSNFLQKGLNGLSGLLGQKDESGVPGNMGSAGADGDQRQPGRLSGERATGSENFPGKVLNPRPNKVLEGQPGEPGRFGLLGMVGTSHDAGERGDICLSGLPGQEGEVGESFPGENGFPGPKRLAGFDGTAVLKGEKGIQGEPPKALNTLLIDIHKESREQGKSGVIGLTGIPGLKGLLVLVTLSCVFITSSAKCILTKKVTGSDQCISIQVCHSTECDGTERWDRIKEHKLEHIYIEGALGGSKMSQKYMLERDNNCSILSIENITKEDIFDATYQFVIGTSDKTKIQLKHEPILYKTNDGDPLKCNGDFARLTINMTVMHIRKHPSFKYYTEREDFNENLTVSQSSEKMGLWFVTTIFSVINIRENNFNETCYLVYKDTKDVIIFDESVICNESKVTVGTISKENKTTVVVSIVIVLAVIVALFGWFGWFFRKKIIQCCRGASFHPDKTVNGESRNLMNTTGQQNDSGVAEYQNKSEPNGKILDEAKSPPTGTEQVNLQDI